MTESELAELKADLSRNVIAIGRMINARRDPNYEDWTCCIEALKMSAKTTKIIRDLTVLPLES
jgi:hypothetical protein